MKKYLILTSLLMLILIGCIKNDNISNITNNSSETGEAVFSGTWPGESIVNGNQNAKFIHYETTQMDVIFTKDSEERSISFNKNSGSNIEGSLKGLAVGTWEVDVILSSSSETVASKSTTVQIATGINNITFLFSQHDYTIGPQNIAELFLKDYIPIKITGFLKSLGIAYLGIESIEIGYTDGLRSYDTFLPMIYVPNITEEDVEVSTGSGIVATVTYNYNNDGTQIDSVNYSNDSGLNIDTAITYTDDLQMKSETETATYSTSTSAITYEYGYTNGYLTDINVDSDYTMNLEYTDGKITSNTRKDSDGTKISTETYDYDFDGNLYQKIESEYDSGETVRGQKTAMFNYEGDLLKDVTETVTYYGTAVEKKLYRYTYNSSDQLIEIECLISVDETMEERDVNGDGDTADTDIIEKGEKVVFSYSGTWVNRVDMYELEYDYVYNGTDYEAYIFEKPIAYYQINYKSDITTTITIGVR